jgi:hypothetical protein
MPAENLTFAMITPLTWESIELGYSLLSATIPNLKSFIMSFDTAMMMSVSFKLNSYSRDHTTEASPNYRIRSNSGKDNKFPMLSDIENANEFIGRLRPENEGIRYTSNIRHSDDWSLSNDEVLNAGPSQEWQQRSIRRDVHWRIEQTHGNMKHDPCSFCG